MSETQILFTAIGILQRHQKRFDHLTDPMYGQLQDACDTICELLEERGQIP